jgi:hypothetical protein
VKKEIKMDWDSVINKFQYYFNTVDKESLELSDAVSAISWISGNTSIITELARAEFDKEIFYVLQEYGLSLYSFYEKLVGLLEKEFVMNPEKLCKIAKVKGLVLDQDFSNSEFLLVEKELDKLGRDRFEVPGLMIISFYKLIISELNSYCPEVKFENRLDSKEKVRVHKPDGRTNKEHYQPARKKAFYLYNLFDEQLSKLEPSEQKRVFNLITGNSGQDIYAHKLGKSYLEKDKIKLLKEIKEIKNKMS